MRPLPSSFRVRKPTAATLALSALALLGAGRAAAQAKVLGAQDCEKCHKAALKKWRVDEPAQYGAKAHAVTQKQLNDPKAAKFAAAIGLASPLDLGGRCVACHATIVRGLVRSGVSCEDCHGAASLWNPVHDKEPLAESYKKALGLGLRDLHQKPGAIAKVCVDCHVTPDKALAAAGHPSGADFDAGVSLKKLVHWTAAFTGDGAEHASYDYAQLSAASRPLVQKALAAGGGKPAAPGPATAAKPGASPAPKPGGIVSGGSISASTPAPGAPRAAPPRPAAPASPPAPWDWDQPVQELPADYPSDDQPAPPPAPDVPAGAPPATGPPAAPPVAPRPRPAAARRLSIVVDQPALPAPEVAVPAPPRAPSAGRSAAGEAAALRAKGGDQLAKLLAAGTRAPDLPPAEKPREFKGPDGELLNIQDVALYLALEILRSR